MVSAFARVQMVLRCSIQNQKSELTIDYPQ